MSRIKSLYVSEHDRIRKIPLVLFGVPGRTSTETRTVAAVGMKGFADGPPLLAQFDQPLGLAVTQTGDLFVADTTIAESDVCLLPALLRLLLEMGRPRGRMMQHSSQMDSQPCGLASNGPAV
jgi:hypothetical protein